MIDWAEIKSETDFYQSVLPQLRAPEWHGRNLDALFDSIGTGRMCAVEPPYRIVIRGIDKVPDDLASFVRKATTMLKEAALARDGITICYD